MSAHQHEADDCTWALEQAQAFLHGELPEDQADVIRMHLDACESCLDNYDVESAITAMIQRCCPPATASSELRLRIVQMTARIEVD